MNVGRYRAWRFLHPDPDLPEEWADLSFSPTGGVEMVEERESVRQASRHWSGLQLRMWDTGKLSHIRNCKPI